MQFGRTSENAGTFVLDPHEIIEREPCLGRIDEKIDVAVGFCPVTGNGAIEIQPTDPKGGEALTVCTESLQGFIATHPRKLPKIGRLVTMPAARRSADPGQVGSEFRTALT
jgi:hypothetical protein